MLRKRSNSRPNIYETVTIDSNIKHIKIRNKSIPILPPSPKSTNDIAVDSSYEVVETDRPTPRVQNSNAMFDPNNASPASDFMNMLKLRMNVYYEQEIDIFKTNL